MSKSDDFSKLEQSVKELYEKYPKDMVSSFLERISEMTAEEFDALVFFCELIDKEENDKQQETTNR